MLTEDIAHGIQRVHFEGVGTCAPGGCSDNRNTGDFNAIPFVSADPDTLDDYQLK